MALLVVAAVAVEHRAGRRVDPHVRLRPCPVPVRQTPQARVGGLGRGMKNHAKRHEPLEAVEPGFQEALFGGQEDVNTREC